MSYNYFFSLYKGEFEMSITNQNSLTYQDFTKQQNTYLAIDNAVLSFKKEYQTNLNAIVYNAPVSWMRIDHNFYLDSARTFKVYATVDKSTGCMQIRIYSDHPKISFSLHQVYVSNSPMGTNSTYQKNISQTFSNLGHYLQLQCYCKVIEESIKPPICPTDCFLKTRWVPLISKKKLFLDLRFDKARFNYEGNEYQVTSKPNNQFTAIYIENQTSFVFNFYYLKEMDKFIADSTNLNGSIVLKRDFL